MRCFKIVEPFPQPPLSSPGQISNLRTEASMNDQQIAVVEPLEKRRHARTPIGGQARVSAGRGWGDRRAFTANVRDASLAGMRLTAGIETGLQVGQTVTIEWSLHPAVSKSANGASR